MRAFDGEKALVRTLVDHKGETFPIDYRLMKNQGKLARV